jgi:aminoglycoside 3-N-acetyltransferase
MSNPTLFKSSSGELVTRQSLLQAFQAVGASECNVLYIHTGLSFGIPNPELRRGQILDEILDAFRSLSVRSLCVPTFTFSFCNSVPYDSSTSKSRMGAFNEHFRKSEEAVRSCDPLMSVALIGKDLDLVENLGKDSIGQDSTFFRLSKIDGVKFLFAGVKLGDCFTYMHHLEWVAKVPYRYDREFKGKITHQGLTFEDSYRLFVRYRNVTPNNGSYTYENLLDERGVLSKCQVGDNFVRCVDEPTAKVSYLDLLDSDPDFFIEEPFDKDKADRRFEAYNMVAL